MSAIISGIGQYGKNQLIYNKELKCFPGIKTFFIYNNVINLPKRPEEKFLYMDMCNNCNECIKKCPVQAIHSNDLPGWLDLKACQNFYYYGDHERISSIKYGLNAFLNNKFSEEELKQIKNYEDFVNLFGCNHKERNIILNGKNYFLDIDYCQECLMNIPCNKLSSHYDKKRYYILAEENINQQS